MTKGVAELKGIYRSLSRRDYGRTENLTEMSVFIFQQLLDPPPKKKRSFLTLSDNNGILFI